ncbi:MAG: glycosyl transferase, partial [Anaerolineae bacterium]|nr:glycosyl transferase [Anaerolineae bacterium]
MSGDVRRILVVQLADIGDLVLSTPALAALRAAHPTDHLALLTTRHAAPILQDAGLVDELLLFDKHAFDRLSALARPRSLVAAIRLAARLRRGRYDAIVFLHHFSTRFGALKFAALAWSAASPRRLGLENGRGFFLTERILDDGFGAKHQAQYWLDLVGLLGVDSTPRPARIGIEEASTHLPPRTARRRVA